MKTKIVSRLTLFLITVFCSFICHAETTWIDVRSAIEHKIDHIEGDARIPYDEIVEHISEIAPDKNTDIQLYCRSGNRAGKAMIALTDAGYTNVSNAGGIKDVRKARSLTE